MEHCAGASVDYYCHPIVVKPTSFYEYYRRPFTNGQLISRESYPPHQAPVMAHQRHDGYLYHHSYHQYQHHHQHHGRAGRGDVTGYDDVMESRCVTSFTELQPTSRASGRSAVVQSLGGSSAGWTSTPPPFTHLHQCTYFTPSIVSVWLQHPAWSFAVQPCCFVQSSIQMSLSISAKSEKCIIFHESPKSHLNNLFGVKHYRQQIDFNPLTSSSFYRASICQGGLGSRNSVRPSVCHTRISAAADRPASYGDQTVSSTWPSCYIHLSTVGVINIAADHQMFRTLAGELSWQRLRRSPVDLYSTSEKIAL